MEVTVITEFGRTISSDNRYRRSERVTDALSFQCAHIQEQLGLEAMIVSDDTGSSWVGSGDLALCRVLARSAPALSARTSDARELQVKTIQSLRGHLRDGDIATSCFAVPNSSRRIFVTGVGRSRMLETGVTGAGAGSRRILGYERVRPVAPVVDTRDALNQAVLQSWNTLFSAGRTESAEAPRGWMGMVDDQRYRPLLAELVSPSLQILSARGVIADDLWSRYRLRSNELELTDGLYLRTLRANLRDASYGIVMGRIEVDLYHRHDRISVPVCPRIRLFWG